MITGCAERPLHVLLTPGVRLPDRYVHIFFADGLRRDTLDELLARGELPNIEQEFVRGGVRWRDTVVCLPSVTYANTVSMLTGVHPGEHEIVNNDWFVGVDPDGRRSAAGVGLDARGWERGTPSQIRERQCCPGAEAPGNERAPYRAKETGPVGPLIRNYSSASTYTGVNDDFDELTIHEMLGDELTANILCPTHRGADVSHMHPVSTGVHWLLGDFGAVNRGSADAIEDVAHDARRVRRWPALTVQYFPGVDEVAHRYGSDGERYVGIVRQLDRDIGRVCEALRASALAERTCFLLVTDHGHTPAPAARRVDLVEQVERRTGLRVRASPEFRGSSHRLAGRLRAYDSVVSLASRMALWHVPSRCNGTLGSTAPNVGDFQLLKSALSTLDCVDLVCTRGDDGSVQVERGSERAVVERNRRGYRYAPAAGDPLGYQSAPRTAILVERGFATAEEWLEATHDHRYPDFPPQIVALFESRAAGDIVTFAAANWTFKPDQASGHGSALASDCVVSYFFAGPGLPRGVSVPYARNLDLLPTVKALLGKRELWAESNTRLRGRARLPGPPVKAGHGDLRAIEVAPRSEVVVKSAP